MDLERLEQINSPEDIKKMDLGELSDLASDIRAFLIEHVSKTGGHLASNLGVVELTLAIHKVFDTGTDRLVLDVGHQCYVHKLLTGRRDGFENLRGFGGMSGFLRPEESKHDACVSGHASNSVSVALGMARARTLLKEDYSVIAVIGDGALTGGLAYEALNDAGQSGEPLIVILNDNEMSIARNVGAITHYLSRLRLKPRYLHFKDRYRRVINKLPGGKAFDYAAHKIKNSIKNMFLQSSLFENMGFTYLGPADGHDLKYMIYLLELARDLKKPVLIHLMTVKGKGYRFSEERPENFHGVSKFYVDSGKPVKNGGTTFSSVFGDTVCAFAKEDRRICAITAAMESGVGLSGFAEKFPDRFFDVGIAEGHAVAMAAGLAKQGMIPFCAIYSTFLQRAYDMIIHDIAISKLHVVLAVDRAGFVGEDGETHHGLFDVGYLSGIPGMTLLSCSNHKELAHMLEYAAYDLDGPVAVRYSRGCEGGFLEDSFRDGEACVKLTEGSDITLVSYGIMINQVLEAASLVKHQGVDCEVLKLNCLCPLNLEKIYESVEKTGKMLVIEDCAHEGGIGQKIAAEMECKGVFCKVILLNTKDRFIKNGKVDELLSACGLDAQGIRNKIMEAQGN